MINLELIDLCIKATFCGCAFVQNKEVTLNSNMHILFKCESLYAVHFSYEKQ